MSHNLRDGFTFTEVMVVILVIGVVASIAMPNFARSVKNSQKSACLANLKLLTSAVEEAKFSGISEGITMDTLVGRENFLRKAPVCPTEKASYVDLDPPRCPTLPKEHYIPPEEL